jgi:phosphatidylserine synthase
MKRLEEMHMLAEALDKRTFRGLPIPTSSLI